MILRSVQSSRHKNRKNKSNDLNIDKKFYLFVNRIWFFSFLFFFFDQFYLFFVFCFFCCFNFSGFSFCFLLLVQCEINVELEYLFSLGRTLHWRSERIVGLRDGDLHVARRLWVGDIGDGQMFSFTPLASLIL